MSKNITISERVDRLLVAGVDSPKSWMKVHGYVEPDFSSLEDWEQEYRKLRAHHLDETMFLFEIIRELTVRIANETVRQ